MKYFIVSDIHSFYDELKEALNEKGYNKENENHTLVVLGDMFDRGPKPLELFDFLMSIDPDRIVFVKGNHEDLFLDLLKRDIPDYYDFTNGTVGTFAKIANTSEVEIEDMLANIKNIEDIDKFINYWESIKRKVKKSEIYQFITSGEMVNYFEVDDFIFTHGFITTTKNQYNSNWRDFDSDPNWYKARWDEGYKMYLKGLFDEEKRNNKTLVCGHIDASTCRNAIEKTNYENYDIYYGDHFIAIDGCTAYTGQVNVLVIEDNKIIK